MLPRSSWSAPESDRIAECYGVLQIMYHEVRMHRGQGFEVGA